MVTAMIRSKGQVTIPHAIRRALGLSAGTHVAFVEFEPGKYAIVPTTSPLQELKGILGKPDQPISIEDMNAVIARRGASAK